ncbi:MAG: RNA 3'-terminal phosphate cyclase [Methanobacterium sp.]
MIEIDGSYGEGGGALLRISTALSALTGKYVHLTNIRANRPKKGLMPQHFTALKAMAQLTHAFHEGLKIGSNEILFYPSNLQGGEYHLDIGTAGSITLLLQSFMIPAAFADSPVKITLRGGTDVRWSPPVDYFINVTCPLLESIGYHSKINLIQRGHYPMGGGLLTAKITPIKKLKPFNLQKLQLDYIKGISHAVKLPENIAIRQAKSAEKFLLKEGYESDIKIQHSNHELGPGSGIVLWTEGKSRVGGSFIGQPGKKAELVGQEAAKELLYHISRKAALDKYMGDQIIPYMALAGYSQIKTAELTQHTLTNIYVTEAFIKKEFKVEGKLENKAIIRVD